MHRLDPEQIGYLTTLRHDLHRRPEVSGEENATAERITTELQALGAGRIWTGLGGHGVAAEFAGITPGPTVMLRCELDGLPIREISDLPYKSRIEGKGHLCGHQGRASFVAVFNDLEEVASLFVRQERRCPVVEYEQVGFWPAR